MLVFFATTLTTPGPGAELASMFFVLEGGHYFEAEVLECTFERCSTFFTTAQMPFLQYQGKEPFAIQRRESPGAGNGHGPGRALAVEMYHTRRTIATYLFNWLSSLFEDVTLMGHNCSRDFVAISDLLGGDDHLPGNVSPCVVDLATVMFGRGISPLTPLCNLVQGLPDFNHIVRTAGSLALAVKAVHQSGVLYA